MSLELVAVLRLRVGSHSHTFYFTWGCPWMPQTFVFTCTRIYTIVNRLSFLRDSWRSWVVDQWRSVDRCMKKCFILMIITDIVLMIHPHQYVDRWSYYSISYCGFHCGLVDVSATAAGLPARRRCFGKSQAVPRVPRRRQSLSRRDVVVFQYFRCVLEKHGEKPSKNPDAAGSWFQVPGIQC